jgi:hypothetical protein
VATSAEPAIGPDAPSSSKAPYAVALLLYPDQTEATLCPRGSLRRSGEGHGEHR